ncbi:bifunctional phosphopantothenoylcysteine decarboxylase/phosphopantothenate--cysteine ligase CoaBC [Paenarthrobacter nicotinovorans]|uniref:bifunctional phosphopantothenoylcysteine decarboxylase/phosphopantothenate--cysteine ligase CoaBC n=1 Tax=Paenarthrobacter nicotinovorans TaxID=29320 RepID=UPI00166D0A67|nr:bifunctional phosphopantothenoylcysteine decarboxylase/phosphopantothenate--cysteine ligase CoaBC [Paenarthrobacter nicotinovorans]MBP2396452.1 phosphopantothenoylcysteine decarboxylase/phosphopantothenate--cysteine ligase [Paenarthrobacter nicotinovorans]UKE97484.1 bifunctional phosphopantothenoylcysteine decarboxylase/phosphopantothenate--cysteine ligase CoaBC [Paenarthrobacter nicotinovorans]UKF02270.1 bifunctional phosphopantothenoylcysteine decarboxylase/phosphopantothenate--cysteine lig
MRIVLGVGGGIAAYKVASLLRLFTEAGHQVTVIPTEAATRFVGVATWEALSGNPVSNSVFDDVDKVNHVRLGHQADLIVIAPATADLLARAATGQANDLLTNTLLMAHGPVLFAPAMHTEMWQHAATQANVETLRSRGATVLEPASGRLTGADSGPGRLPEPDAIFAAAIALAEASGTSDSAPPASATHASLVGRTVTISAGGTREALDPVRFLGNRSSGKQGAALAAAALAAGAKVRFLAAHMDVEPPAGVELVRIESALELREAALKAAVDSDVVIMAAAVADFRPAEVSDTKIKKVDGEDAPVVRLVRNPDILRELVQRRTAEGGRQLIVGFAAETGDAQGDVLEHAAAKLKRKGCDLLVVNQVGVGRVFGQDDNSVVILSGHGAEPQSAAGSKTDVAAAVIDRVGAELAQVFPAM